jgi:hypothetical protein
MPSRLALFVHDHSSVRHCLTKRLNSPVPTEAGQDKLDGKISDEFWERKNADWRDAQLRIRASIEKHENANRYYFDEGCQILDLAGRAYDLWLKQDSFGKRELLNIVLSNCSFDGVSLTATYAKPFCWLAEGLVCSDWLPLLDSLGNWMGTEQCRELAASL